MEKQTRISGVDLVHDIAGQVIALRLARGVTQARLAQYVGTKQSAISRLEGADHFPSLALLQKIAHVLGARVEVIFRLQPPGEVEG
jgi:transcriptional regulator with XRE-family HTH domain